MLEMTTVMAGIIAAIPVAGLLAWCVFNRRPAPRRGDVARRLALMGRNEPMLLDRPLPSGREEFSLRGEAR